MNHRAIQSFFWGVFLGVFCEALRTIWQEEVQKAQADLHKCQRSELTESYSRGGTDQWDLTPNN